MRTCLLAPLAVLLLCSPASAAVIVVANYTPAEVAFTITEPGEKPRKETLSAHQVAAFVIAGPADMSTPVDAKMPLRVEPYNAYVFIPDRAAGVRVELIELPGKPPEADARPEPKPLPRDPVKIPVTLLVDDADPRVDALWKEETRKRFDRATGIFEAHTGFHLEFAGFDTWKSDPTGKQIEGQLTTFEGAVGVKQGALAIGFLSRKLDVGKDPTFGACSGRGAGYVLVREWLPKSETEKIEVLVRYLAVAFGASTTPDPGSVMRAKLGDGQAMKSGYVIRLDPLNVLALNLWADQWRAGGADPKVLPAPDRARLLRVYKAMLLAAPDDPYSPGIIRDLEKDQAKEADPAAGKPPPLTGERLKRAEAVRAVVQAITDRAKTNIGKGALTGDALTAEFVRVAVDTAMKAEEVDRAPAFLLGLGIALDDGASLRDSPLTGASVRDVESDTERKERLGVLGNPTLHGRRDLCRRFAAGCGVGELLTSSAAENAAVSESLLSLQRPTGFGFPSLAAECAGIAFARSVEADPKLLLRLRDTFTPADLIPDTAGLRDGIGADKFEDDFGGPADERFRSVLADIRKRVKALPVNKTP